LNGGFIITSKETTNIRSIRAQNLKLYHSNSMDK